MLLRLAYLGVTSAFARLRLLPMSDREKDVEILALRHRIGVLERQLNGQQVRFHASDRAFLASLLHGLPREVLRGCGCWCGRTRYCAGTATSSPADTLPSPGRSAEAGPAPCTRPGRWCCAWPGKSKLGYRRLHGELLVLGVKVAASTVWEILKEADADPAPGRASSTWADFLRSQADALLACDFFEAVTPSGARLYVFAVIEHASRRIRILGTTAHPTASWVVQAAENLVMDLKDADCRARCLIRDRDGKFPRPFDEVLKDAGIEVVLSGVRMPRMNSIMERWVQTCRRELPDRTLIRNQRHLLRALREFETFYNEHRPHQGLANARPLHSLPAPIEDPDRIAHLDIRRRARLGGTLHECQHAA